MKKAQLTYLILAAIIIGGSGLACLLYSGPFYSFDDGAYLTYGHQLLQGNFTLAESPYAYGFLLPASLALSFELLGTSIFASVLPALIEYVILILLAFLVGRKLYGEYAGLLSAFLLATAPFVVGYSTRVLPDMAVGMLAGFSILFFVYAQHEKSKRLFYFLSGASAALIVYVKMIGFLYVLFFLCCIGIHGVLEYKRKRHTEKTFALAYAIYGLIAFMLIYAAIFYLAGSSPTTAIVSYGQNQNVISPTNLSKNIGSLATVLLGYSSPTSPFAPFMDPQVFPLGLITLFAILGSAIGLIRKEMNVIFLSVILWGVFLYLFFGTVTLATYSFITVISRYFILVSVPTAVLASYSILKISRAIGSRSRALPVYIAALFVLAIILTNIPLYSTLYNYNISIRGDLNTFSKLLNYFTSSANGRTNLFITDNGTALSMLRFISSYNRNLSLSPLDFSEKANVAGWANATCNSGAPNAYFALIYANHSRSLYETVFDNWVRPYCNLTEIETIRDNASLNSSYNGMNVEVDLYKINS